MPAIETAGAFNAETTSPARSPVRNRAREPRKTPGFQRLHRRTRRHPDWLAEGTVFSEPVSHPKFPVPRENTGNSAVLQAVGRDLPATRPEIPRVSRANSLNRRTGNFRIGTGKNFPPSGNSVARAGNAR